MFVERLHLDIAEAESAYDAELKTCQESTNEAQRQLMEVEGRAKQDDAAYNNLDAQFNR